MESYMDVLKDRADQEECYAWAVHEIERKDVEIERLREALQQIKSYRYSNYENAIQNFNDLQNIARAALKEGE